MQQELRLFESSYCGSCELATECRAPDDDRLTCPRHWGSDMPGGPFTSHPADPATQAEIRTLGGVQLNTKFKPLPVRKFDLPSYLPQPRYRPSFKGWLNEDDYMVRLNDVLLADRIRSAAEVREKIGLPDDRRVHLAIFDDDELLEKLWWRGLDGIRELAEGDYASISSPSFSTYWPRNRTEYLINVRRSQLYFIELQRAGAIAIPRLAWRIRSDAERFSEWANRNPSLEVFCIDLMMDRTAADWATEMDGLTTFDELTGSSHQYLINGPTTEDRFSDLMHLLSPDRVTITNATSQVQIPPRRFRTPGGQAGPTFGERTHLQRSMVHSAVRLSRSEHVLPKAA